MKKTIELVQDDIGSNVDLSKVLLGGEKFSGKKLDGVLQALDFINDFDAANDILSNGLLEGVFVCCSLRTLSGSGICLKSMKLLC